MASKSLLIFALNVIKEECCRHNYCNENCPFYDPDEDGMACGIQTNPPSEWDILEEEPVKEKLL